MSRRDSIESSLAFSVLTRRSRRACATPVWAAAEFAECPSLETELAIATAKILETFPDINKLMARLTT